MHDLLYLRISNEYLIFEPAANSKKGNPLVIHRASQTVIPKAPISDRQEEVVAIYGIVGIVTLHAGDYMIVITGKKKEGMILGKDIWNITKHMIIPTFNSRHHLTEYEMRDDEVYLALIEEMMRSTYHYFSYSYDLTHSQQRQRELQGPIWLQADDRFFWNKFLCSKLIGESSRTGLDLTDFILPVICGFVSIHSVRLRGKAMTYAVISRRSRFRAGTRYNVRGLDVHGYVANHVETEQLIIDQESSAVCSYLQTRGSIPLFWKQIVNVKYTPKLEILGHLQTFEAFKKHFDDQIQRYGKQIVINLINNKGYEYPLAKEFNRYINMLRDDRVRYIHFDFHRECSKMRWDRISLLVRDIETDLIEQGYFMGDEDSVIREQSSIVRTNCMDCLDRTNVIQSILSKRMLNIQLIQLDILEEGQSIDLLPEFERLYRNVWADNADAISSQYSGTGALKTDFTRTGKRTKKGALKDGLNSVIRYIKNNYMDGWRQDAYELFHGEFRVMAGIASPFRNPLQRDMLFPILLVLSLFIIIFLLSVKVDLYSRQLIYVLFWICTGGYSLQQILRHGHKYVDRPRLRKEVVIEQNNLMSVDYEKKLKNV